ncbi:hypothetical protein M409DRAFT_30480 [Zasmidium cellare ATCC 36951]|uniref:Uncharacterized protein n=1 Tax=Zasmidium cellare ATCC 36951 TaxID=1080233 RepID=A0A6A6BYN6_ZASCE|nr:uncharacterized protein M409DRAFT_30480 [Zasmidium cellare ATCC 36951]KAF2159060.1 hypothetical protein M409DRAFT_30480 [Zasmidium cellare ATCC 36951]
MYNPGAEDSTFGPIRTNLFPTEPGATVFQQYQLGNAAFQVGTGPLTGCSAVIVVLKRAVYIGHIWETETWSCSAAAFRRRALSYFSGEQIEGEGDRFNPRLYNMQPEGDDRRDDTRVFVMHPRRTQSYANPQRSNYRAKVPELLTAIRDAVGWQDVPLALYNYIPVNEDNADGTPTAANTRYIAKSEVGTALFQ